MANASQSSSDFKGDRLSARMFGAKGDCVFTEATVSAGSQAVTVTATLSAADLGKAIWVENAAAGGADLLTTIAAVTGANTLTTAAAAGASVTAGACRYGSDDTAAIQALVDWAPARGKRVYLPRGSYLTTASILLAGSGLLCQGDAFGYAHWDANYHAATEIVCCAPVPVFTSALTVYPGLIAPQWRELTLIGTAKSGSKGIYLPMSTMVYLERVTFDYFGDQAILVDDGVDGTIEEIQAINCLLVDGRTSYVGVVQVRVTDLKARRVIATSSAPTYGTGVGSGYIAGILYDYADGFFSDCFGHHSPIGIYVGPRAIRTTFVNVRADGNQGQGWVIDAGQCQFIGCRTFNNSAIANGAYDAFLITGGGNIFANCQITYGGGASGQCQYAFHTTTPNTLDANHFLNNYVQPSCFVLADYRFTGSQTQQVIEYPTNHELPGNAAKVLRNGAVLLDKSQLVLKGDTTYTAADEQYWTVRTNYGPGYQQLFLACLADDASHDSAAIRISRSGMTPTDLAMLCPFTLEDLGAPVDNQIWAYRINRGLGYNQLLLAAVDGAGVEGVWCRVSRTGHVINSVELPSSVTADQDLTVLLPANNAHSAVTCQDAQTLKNKDLTDASNTLPAITSAALPAVGSAGTYTKVTTDAKGRVTAGAAATAADVGALGATAAAGGDLTGNYPSPILAACGSGAASYGDGTHTPQLTIDAKGRVTAGSQVATDNTAVRAEQNSGLTATTTPTNIPGLSLALTRSGAWLVTASLQGNYNAGDGALLAQLYDSTNSSAKTPTLYFGSYHTGTQTWIYTSFAGNETLLMQGWKQSGTGASAFVYSGVNSSWGTLTALWLHP